MIDENKLDKLSQLEEIWEHKSPEDLKESLIEFPTGSVVEFLEEKEDVEIVQCLTPLPIEDKGRIFSYFSLETQLKIKHILENKEFGRIFSSMYSDTRADLYQALEPEEQVRLLPYLNKQIREDVIVLSSYPPETAGGIMGTDFATVENNMTCEEAISKIRKDSPKKLIYYIYVVDSDMKMLGIITLKSLILSPPAEPIESHINTNFIFAYVGNDREEVAKEIEKHDLVAIPILNQLKQIVGIVTHEDAIDIIRAEHTEDMEKFMGMVPGEDEAEYLDSPTLNHFKKRVVWLVSLAAIGLISGIIIHQYQKVLEQLIILALYMPMMTATGGNTGSQAATLVIRAMALDEIEFTDWHKVLWKELKVSFLLSFCVGGLVFIKIGFLTSLDLIPPGFTAVKIAFLISLAIGLQVISSALVGAGLPLLVKRLNGDPAVAASPAITTVVDITGLLIYFSIASQVV